MPDSQSTESPLLPFRSLGIFVLSMTPQFTELYKWIPGYRRSWKCDWIVAARNCCNARMLPREAELVPEFTSMYRWFTCEAILQVVRWPRGARSCFQLLNAPWGSRCKAALNMLVDVCFYHVEWHFNTASYVNSQKDQTTTTLYHHTIEEEKILGHTLCMTAETMLQDMLCIGVQGMETPASWVRDKASPFAMGEFWSWLAKPKKSAFAKVAKGYTGKSTNQPILRLRFGYIYTTSMFIFS